LPIQSFIGDVVVALCITIAFFNGELTAVDWDSSSVAA